MLLLEEMASSILRIMLSRIPFASVIALSVFILGIHGFCAEPDIPGLLRDLDNPDLAKRQHAAHELLQIKPKTQEAAEALIRGLKNSDLSSRCKIGETLGGIGPINDRVVPALMEAWAAGDPCSTVARLALEKCGAPAAAALAEKLLDRDFKQRPMISMMLDRMAPLPKDLVPILLEALKDSDLDKQYLVQALIKTDPKCTQAVPLLERAREASVVNYERRAIDAALETIRGPVPGAVKPVPFERKEYIRGECGAGGMDFHCDGRVVALHRQTGRYAAHYAPASMMAALTEDAKFRCSADGKVVEVTYTDCSENPPGPPYLGPFYPKEKTVQLSLPTLAVVETNAVFSECGESAAQIHTANHLFLSRQIEFVKETEEGVFTRVPTLDHEGKATKVDYFMKDIGMSEFIGNGMLCQALEDGNFDCFDLLMRKKLWRLEEKFQKPVYWGSMKLYRDVDHLFIATSPYGLYSVDANTGKILWKAEYYSNGMGASSILTTKDFVILAPAVRYADLMQCSCMCEKPKCE